MATKNKSIHAYDLDSVFEVYTSSISEQKNQKIQQLNAKISENETVLASLEEELKIFKASLKKKPTIDSRTSTDLEIKLQNLKEARKKLVVMSDAERSLAETNLSNAQTIYESNVIAYNALIATDVSTLTPSQKAAHTRKVNKAKDLLDKSQQQYETFKNAVTQDDENKERLVKLNQEIQELEDQIIQIVSFETKEFLDKKDKRSTDYKSAAEIYAEIKKVKSETETLRTELSKVTSSNEDNLENFKKFLTKHKFSTVHAETLYDLHKNPKNLTNLAMEEFKIRKMHPKRDFFIKKILIPAVLTGAGIGAAAGVIATSGLIGGSTMFGIIPVSGTPGLTTLATTITGAGLGLLSTPAIIKSKNLVTRKHYKRSSKSINENIKDLTSGTSIENLKISKLIHEIQATKHKILESRGLKKHILNKINRNRIHQVEAFTKDLMMRYVQLDRDETVDSKIKAQNLKPIYDILKSIEQFVISDIAESKVHAMLTCKEKKNHTHKLYTFENVDIFANLKIYLDNIASTEETITKAKLAQAKATVKNLQQKRSEAEKIVSGERLITKMLNYESKYARFHTLSDSETTVLSATSIDSGNKVVLILENGKSIELNATDVPNFAEIAKVKIGKSKTTIIYNDGSTCTINKPATPTAEEITSRKILLEILKTDPDFVQSLKDQGYKQVTINTLVSKLEAWVANPSAKLNITKSSNAGKLYVEALETIHSSVTP